MKYRDKYNLILSYQKSKKGRLFILLSLLTVLTFIYLYLFLQWDIRKGIANYSNNHCNLDQECLVSLQATTPFKWDRAYILPTDLPLNKINQVIGLHYPYPSAGGIGVTFIFIQDNQVIYSESYFSDPDFYSKKQLSIHFSYNSVPKGVGPKYYYLTPENDQLWIKKQINKMDEGDIFFYRIKPTNENQSEKGNPYKK